MDAVSETDEPRPSRAAHAGNHTHPGFDVWIRLGIDQRDGCVLMPFAHLSSRLAAPDRARELLNELCVAVHEQNCTVSLASFGFHKDLDLHFAALGHPGSVAFREF